MADKNFGAAEFEAERARLKGIAYRMLGSRTEAEDAVQEAWLRLNRAGAEGIESPRAWLTTVIARICLDMLRQRKLRKEEALEPGETPAAMLSAGPDFDFEIADSVGLALLIVLETLGPAERVAFVLHDMFDMPFEDIAPVVDRTADAARQLASRARRRVRGAPEPHTADRERKREVVEAFLKAARGGDFQALLSMLDPDVVFRADAVARKLGSMGAPAEMRGADAVAAAFNGRAQAAHAVLVDGELGILVVPAGRLLMVVRVELEGDRIKLIDAIAEPDRLQAMELSALD